MTVYSTEKQLEEWRMNLNIPESENSEYVKIEDLNTTELDVVVSELMSADFVKFNKRPNINFVFTKKGNEFKKYIFPENSVELKKTQTILKLSSGKDYLVELVLNSNNSENNVFDNKYKFLGNSNNLYLN